MDNDLGDHRIIERRHPVSRIDISIYSHARATRKIESRNRARRRGKSVGAFGVDATLDCVADNDYIVLTVSQRLSFSDPNLIPHDVRERNHLGHRMLNLNAGIHFHEIETIVLVEQKLERPGTGITDRLAGRYRELAHLLAQPRRHYGRRRFL